MADVKLDQAWDRLVFITAEFLRIPEEALEITRDGLRFAYRFDWEGHDFAVWATAEAPRYNVQIDGVLSLRCNNVRGLFLVIKLLAKAQSSPYTGNEVWDE
jgi:hypothetical protein